MPKTLKDFLLEGGIKEKVFQDHKTKKLYTPLGISYKNFSIIVLYENSQDIPEKNFLSLTEHLLDPYIQYKGFVDVLNTYNLSQKSS